MNNALLTFFFEVRAYIEDTDAGGIVYHANYLNFLERARTECLRSLGFDKRYLFNKAHIFVVHSLNCQYKKPALLDELLKVEASILQLKKSSIVFRQNIYRGEELLLEAQVKVACVNKTTLKPARIEHDMYQILNAEIAKENNGE